MTKRQFWISVLIVLVIACAIGPASYFSYQASLAKQEKDLALEKERTERSREGWASMDKMLKRLPFMDRGE